MNIDDNLNEKTKQLFDSLINQRLRIELEVRPDLANQLNGRWGMNTTPYYKIISPTDNPNPSAFAHELLHIYLFTIGFQYKADFNSEINVGTQIFTDQFLYALNNNLAHLKMINLFEQMGFSKDEFLNEIPEDQLKIARTQIGEIKRLSYKNEIMERFIGLYSIVLLYKNYFGQNIEDIEIELKDIDNNLFTVCETIFEHWISSTNADNYQFFRDLKTQLIKTSTYC